MDKNPASRPIFVTGASTGIGNDLTRRLVGSKWEGDRVIHALLEKLLDENDNSQHNYSQAELAELLARKIEARKE